MLLISTSPHLSSTGEHPAAMSHNAASSFLPTKASNSFSSHFRTLSFAIWLLLVAYTRKLLTSSSFCCITTAAVVATSSQRRQQHQHQQQYQRKQQVKQLSQVKGQQLHEPQQSSNTTSNCCNHKNSNSSHVQKCHRRHAPLLHDVKPRSKQQLQQKWCTKVMPTGVLVSMGNNNDNSRDRNDKCSYSQPNEKLHQYQYFHHGYTSNDDGGGGVAR